MSEYIFCFGCGNRVRRGYPMVTEEGKDVIICEKCMRLWKKHKAKEVETTKKENEDA